MRVLTTKDTEDHQGKPQLIFTFVSLVVDDFGVDPTVLRQTSAENLKNARFRFLTDL